MTGVTNQVQTPLGSGVQSSLALAVSSAGGESLIPLNPTVTYTGTWISGYQFSLYNASIVNNSGFTPNIIAATYDDAQTETALTSLNLGGIQQLNGSYTPTMAALTSFSAPSLLSVTGDFSPVVASATTFSVPNLYFVNGTIAPTLSSMTSLSFPNLVYMNNNFTPTGNSIASVSAPNLVKIGGRLNPSLSSLTSLTMTNLTTIGNNINIIAPLTTLSLPALVSSVGNSSTLNSLTTLSLPNYTTCTNSFIPSFNSLVTLSLPAFTTMVGIFSPSGAAALVTVSLPAIVSMSSTVAVTPAPNLANFSFGSTLKSIGGNVTLTSCALTQASVDSVLVSLAALDGTNGTTAWSSKTVDLSGGTSSAPSATGLAAKVTLVARSCTVTTN